MAGVKVLHDGRAIASWTDTSQALSSMDPYIYQINKNKKMFNLNFYPFEHFKRRLCSSLAAFNKQTKVKRRWARQWKRSRKKRLSTTVRVRACVPGTWSVSSHKCGKWWRSSSSHREVYRLSTTTWILPACLPRESLSNVRVPCWWDAQS